MQQVNGERVGAILHAIAKQEKPQGSVVGVRNHQRMLSDRRRHALLVERGGDRLDLFFCRFLGRKTVLKVTSSPKHGVSPGSSQGLDAHGIENNMFGITE